MSEWPKSIYFACGRTVPPCNPGEHEHLSVVPADLARELYEALCDVRDNGWYEAEKWTHPDPSSVIARYEREVGDG